ncbi:hypothetical protein C0995_001506 [Termitomyces sp. Mi166|nr:hypothetical protein C0995_001506 [Termitomyces sp. Mi166\
MANPRQRRKARSSSHKPVSHSRHAKRKLKKMPPIRGPKILQDAWDKTKTVRQNYVALGLVHDLNPTAPGGSEPIEVRSQIEESEIASTSELESRPPIRKGFGKIIRDDAGNVLRIELPEDDNETRTEKPQDEGLGEPEVDGAVLGPWVTDLGGGGKINLSSGDGNVVQVSSFGTDIKRGAAEWNDAGGAAVREWAATRVCWGDGVPGATCGSVRGRRGEDGAGQEAERRAADGGGVEAGA